MQSQREQGSRDASGENRKRCELCGWPIGRRARFCYWCKRAWHPRYSETWDRISNWWEPNKER